MNYITISEGDVYKAAFYAMQEIANDQTISKETAADMVSGVCRATRKLLNLFGKDEKT